MKSKVRIGLQGFKGKTLLKPEQNPNILREHEKESSKRALPPGIPGSFWSQAIKSAPRLFLVTRPQQVRRQSSVSEGWGVNTVIEAIPGKTLSELHGVDVGDKHNHKRVLDKLKTRPITRKWLEEHGEELVRQLARRSAEMTKKGVAHVDVKPINIVVNKLKNGKPKLTLIDWEAAVPIQSVNQTHLFKHDYAAFSGVANFYLNELTKLSPRHSSKVFRKEYLKQFQTKNTQQKQVQRVTRKKHVEKLKNQIRSATSELKNVPRNRIGCAYTLPRLQRMLFETIRLLPKKEQAALVKDVNEAML